jgi:hypothetical protein
MAASPAPDFSLPGVDGRSYRFADVAGEKGAIIVFFGYGADGKLKYLGRLDKGRASPPPPGARRELLEAMLTVATEHKIPQDQAPAIGCSIKWKPGGAKVTASWLESWHGAILRLNGEASTRSK